MTDCRDVRERLAALEALDAAGEAHLAACPDCAGWRAARDGLARAFAARPVAEPGPGFETRLVARALAPRRGSGRPLVAGLAAAVGAAAVAALLLVRAVDDGRTAGPIGAAPAAGDAATAAAAGSAREPVAPVAPDESIEPSGPVAEQAGDDDESAVAAAVALSELDVARGAGARWDYIEEPLAAYALFMQEEMP